jgi:hypothetical protein
MRKRNTALPVTLSHLRTPPVRVPDVPAASCPHCHAPTPAGSAGLEHKRRREDASDE